MSQSRRELKPFFDWYRTAYDDLIDTPVPTADARVTLFTTRQPPGRYPDAPSADFSIQIVERQGARAQIDQGAGRFRRPFNRGEFVVGPPGHANDYRVEDDIRLLIMPLPPDVVGRVAEAEGRGALRDLGRLHARSVQEPVVTELVRRLFMDNQGGHKTSRLMLDAALDVIAGTLLRAAEAPPPEGAHVALPDWAVRRIRDMLMSDPACDVSLEELAEAVGYSPYHFQRAFKAATGLSPHRYQRELRLQRAMHLLATTELPVTAIAQDCGFDSPAYFATLFRREIGASPRAYRRQLRA